MDVDGRARARRALALCSRRTGLACNEKQLSCLESERLSTAVSLFCCVFLDGILYYIYNYIYIYIYSWTLMDGRAPGARLVSGARWGRASVLCEARARRPPGAQ